MISRIEYLNTLKGLYYILMFSGDLFLIDFKKDIIDPDYSQMNSYEIDQITLLFECIYDREAHDINPNKGTFMKTIKIKDIETLIEFGKITSF